MLPRGKAISPAIFLVKTRSTHKLAAAVKNKDSFFERGKEF